MKFKKVFSILIGASLVMSSSVTNVLANAQNSNITDNTVIIDEYDFNGARNAAYDTDNIEFLPLPRTSTSKTWQTPTGGTLTSNVWVGNTDSSGSYNYQVSANYNKDDHTDIKTTWFGEAYASTGGSFGIGLDSISFGASTETRQTPSRYWHNNKGQWDASYATNGYANSNVIWYAISNRAQVWGGSLGAKPTEVNARAQVNN